MTIAAEKRSRNELHMRLTRAAREIHFAAIASSAERAPAFLSLAENLAALAAFVSRSANPERD
jgi:hypothetical protein